MRGIESSVQQCLQASQVICRRGVVSSHRVRRHYDTARTSRRTAMLRPPEYNGANDPRQPVCPDGERPATQSDSNITSVGAPGCDIVAPPTERTVHVVLCKAAVVPRSHSCGRVCCCYTQPDRWCSPQRDGHPALSPVSQTFLANCCVFVFRSPLTNGHQRLQPLNLPSRCLHSLCNAVGGQHSRRKPRRGAGRLSTTPDTKNGENENVQSSKR